ncbi:PrtD family type I secretion system ABC transporter [Azospirillum fermentarium]|uniref:type I secretion system permease/ATPase n=1 Tax=Azospirillum fermentarium TaxID=1233114 RepID=UPI0022278A7E|nr:type I secretion system permease/ATPase [Azospirillum fermentarium]MCW2248794.1 PrtD family type I secretion system ABC transporter [Azospirillum fermentarium]
MLVQCRPALVWTGGFSLLINILALTSSLYMMQVYDRVVPSGHLSTLIFLTLMAVSALGLMAFLDYVRGRILAVSGDWLKRRLGATVLERLADRVLAGRDGRTEALRDLAALRGTMAGGAAFLFDTPWVPVYVAVVYLLHPVLGHLAVGSVAVLAALVIANDRVTRRGATVSAAAGRRALMAADSAVRNAEVVDALHLLPGLLRRWQTHHDDCLDRNERVQRRSAVLLAVTRFLRQVVQVAVLGLGAWLSVRHEISGGAMIAASIVLGRALAPVEQAIGGWRQTMAGWEALGRIRTLLSQPMRRAAGLPLPEPAGHLTVQNVVYRAGDPAGPVPPRPILQGVSFEVRPGEALAVVGPSAAGKSTLARLLVGLHPPLAGAVRLDGADLFQWRRDDVARHLGYLPQDVALFGGTVAENIARLGDPDPAAVVAAAQAADCHGMILRLPRGYDTDIGEGGAFLSGGQRQRLALARALYGSPRLVVLDEPNASLDPEGEEALNRAVAGLKERGASVVLIGHRPSTLGQVDRILVLRDGRVDLLGPRNEVIEALKRRTLHSVPSPSGPSPSGPRPAPVPESAGVKETTA